MKATDFIQLTMMLFLLTTGCDNNQNRTNKETPAKDELWQTTTAISKDGTTITYDKMGKGPTIIIVNGALTHRKIFGKELAVLLAKKFTVILYDRRGRGESADARFYTVEKEIEDIEALIAETGDGVYLYGGSSGGALAMLAAEKLGPEKVTKLALYELPYGSDTKEEFAKEKDEVKNLVKDGKSGDAITFFMQRRGTPPDKMEGMKQSPAWNDMLSMEHTLVYDFEVLGDGTIPIAIAKNITIPTLVLDGEKSFDFMSATADSVAKVIPGAVRKTLKAQTHNVSPEAVAPVLIEFFSK